jgi:ketosteroid isomerase-like protein
VSQKNVEIVEDVFQSLQRAIDDAFAQDRQAFLAAVESGELPPRISEALAFLDPDAEWHPPDEDPDAAHREGREAIVTYLAQWFDAWEYWRIEPESLLDAGDKVVAFVRHSGKGRGSGFEIPSFESAHVITLKEGRVARIEGFYDRSEALKAAGLSEKPE